MNSILKITLISCLAFLLSACGSDSDNNEPSFASTLETSVYKDGVWDFSSITIKYYVYDADNSTWAERTLKTNSGSLDILENGLAGTTSILKIMDGVSALETVGDSLDGFTVGETLTIQGFIDGTTTGLVMTSETGMTASLIAAPYDGDVVENAEGKWIELGYWDGVGAVSVKGSISGSDSYVGSPTFNDAQASSVTPLAAEVPMGSGDSIYVDGTYAGSGYTYMTYNDNGWGYESVEYDISVTTSGNTLTGTMTLTDLDDMPDIEGYGVGDTFEIKGTIKGSIIYITCTDSDNSDFIWKHIWGSSYLNNRPQVELAGDFTSIEAYYGVTYRTSNTFGGESEFQLDLQVTE